VHPRRNPGYAYALMFIHFLLLQWRDLPIRPVEISCWWTRHGNRQRKRKSWIGWCTGRWKMCLKTV